MNELIAEGSLLLDKYEREKKTGGELLSDLRNAVTYYTRAIDLGCRGAEIYGNRAAAHNWLKDYNEAFADICRAIELDPSNGVYLFNRGIAYAEKEDWERAFIDFFEAIKIYSSANCEQSELLKIIETAKIIYKFRFKKVFEDKFYILLLKFIAEYGKDIFCKKTLRPLLLDFAVGENKKDIKILFNIHERNILEEFRVSENPEAERKRVMQIIDDSYPFRKDNIGRVIDILCCLLLYDDFFKESDN